MLATLANASLDGALLVAVVWAVTRGFRSLSAATRTVLWWCAAAKFVVALVWIAPVAVPILPAAMLPASERPASERAPTNPSGPSTITSSLGTIEARAESDQPGSIPRAWPALLAGLWGMGVMFAAGLGLRRWRQTQALLERARQSPDEIRAMTIDVADRLALRRVPRVLTSDELQTPLVTGLLRPTVLLPSAGFQALTDRQQRMALCHELAHVKRADLWLGCLPACAERVFFFHPLAHLAAREYGLWREAACDATVLNALDASPREYGRLLLALGVSRPQAGLAAAGASWSFSSLKRRIAMLHEPSARPFTSRLLAAGVVAVAAGAMVPMQLTARSPHPVTVHEDAEPAPALVVAAHAALAPAATRDAGGQATDGSRRGKDDLNYVMMLDDTHWNMSGSSRDVDRARRYKRPGERLLWFRHDDGREFVVRDRAVLEEVEALWKRVGELGGEMGVLGGKQGELGARQGEIGAKQGELGAEQGNLGARQGRLGARQAVAATRDLGRLSDAQRIELEKERSTIELEMRELDAKMALLGTKMEELGRPMSELGRQMEVLGREMEVLGKKMEEEVKKAERGMRELMERTVRTGIAEAVR